MSGNIAGSQLTLAQPADADHTLSAPTRLFYIDNMRVILIILVVVGHMAITYGAPIGDWYYHEEGEVSTAFSIITIMLLGIGVSFLLGLFFMIAGYFSPGPIERKGVTKFSINRLVRLGIPLLIYALLINPLVTYWAAVHGGYAGSYLQYLPNHLPQLINASVGPLWFVEALLIFSLVYSFMYALRIRKTKTLPEYTIWSVPNNVTILTFSLFLGLLTFLVRIWAPFGWWWEPIHQEPGHLPQYAILFLIGVLAYRNKWFENFPSYQARIWGWISLLLIPGFPALAIAAGALEGSFDQAIAGGFTWLSLTYSLWETFIGVALVITTLIWFRDKWNHQGVLMREMASSAYAVYVLHPILIVPLALALSRLQINLSIKFLLFSPLAVAICFLTAYFVRKVPPMKYVL